MSRDTAVLSKCSNINRDLCERIKCSFYRALTLSNRYTTIVSAPHAPIAQLATSVSGHPVWWLREVQSELRLRRFTEQCEAAASSATMKRTDTVASKTPSTPHVCAYSSAG